MLPVYERFIRRYPDFESLSNAKVSSVNALIKSLGLLYRAKRLINIAQYIQNEFEGILPLDADILIEKHGIGKYIASAVACFAHNKKIPIVDTNVIRILERVFGIQSKSSRQRDDKAYWNIAASILPSRRYRDFNYALLDFSAIQCTAKNPAHETCLLNSICKFYLKQCPVKARPVGIDVFAGAGGLSLGFERAGFNICYAIEKDKHAAETYGRNRESNPDLIVDTRDINEIKPTEVLRKLGLKRGDLDIVIGGPPCQGFSSSNMKTRNLANPQNQLVFKFIEYINALNPKWFLMENVAGLDSFENGLLRDILLSEFRGIGYQTESVILNSVNFGVPQSRNRIFFLGNRVGNNMDFIQNLVNTKPKRVISVRDAIGDLPALENGNNINDMGYTMPISKLTAYQREMRKEMNGRVLNNLTTRHTDLAIERFKHIRQGENLLALAKRRPDLVSNYKNVGNTHHWIYMRLPWDKPSVTLNNFRKNMVVHPSQNRGLSVREAARLQSFPDKYVFHGSIHYMQQHVANAVPPELCKTIADAIMANL